MASISRLATGSPRIAAISPAPATPAKARGPAIAKDQARFELPTLDAELVKRALVGGEVRFRNDQGGEGRLAVTRTGEGRFDLSLDGRKLPVKIGAGLPAEEALARIADYMSQLPPAMRAGVSSLEVSTKPGGDAAATTYNGKRVVFWDGMAYLRPSTFFHEMGHVNAKRLYGHTDPSDAWDRAQASDPGRITDYAGTNDNEDFAEMVEAYWLARRGDGTYSLAELREKFPARMKIVEDIAAGRPVETKDSDYWRVFGFQIPKPKTIWNDIGGPELLEKARSLFDRFNPFK